MPHDAIDGLVGFHLAPSRCCDNCAAGKEAAIKSIDVSEAAAAALRAVGRMSAALSFGQLEKLLRGSREKKLLADGHQLLPEYAAARALGRAALPRLLRALIAKRMLREDCLPSSHGGFRSIMRLGACSGVPWGAGEAAAGNAAPSYSVMAPPNRGSVRCLK